MNAVTSSGADIVFGGSANDTIDGGGGNDISLTAAAARIPHAIPVSVSNYIFTLNTNGSVTVADQRAGTPDGTDTDINIQNYQFGDGLVPDTGSASFCRYHGNSGQ